MKRRTCSLTLAVSLAALSAVACDPLDPHDPAVLGPEMAPDPGSAAVVAAVSGSLKEALLAFADRMEPLRAGPANTALAAGAWLGAGGEAMGATFFFADWGNKQLPLQWVPGDPRRNGRTDVAYAAGGAGLPFSTATLSEADVGAAIDRAMSTWDNQSCSDGLVIPERTFLDWLTWNADILHAGFTPLPEGVLAVTGIVAFVDAEEEPTDIDRDGAADAAFAFILYNSLYPWRIDANIDLETVALHEAGHGLGQDHFGMAFVTLSNQRLHITPLAVMNAAYSGIRQSLQPTDLAGHCSLYSSWPLR